jgi:pimeloyl-ACP methyl ester carboxylesterase
MLSLGEGEQRRRLAVQADAPAGPHASCGTFWLPGFKSDMASTKAAALAAWASHRGLACTRFDYSGHGLSEGRFEDGSVSLWLEDALGVFTRCTTGPQIVVGSSMGGYIALLMLRDLIERSPDHAARVRALVLIAPAWDMTEQLIEPSMTAAQRSALERDGVVYRPSEYGDPLPITRLLIEDGRRHRLDGAGFNPGRPVHVLQGGLDPDVPVAHAARLETILTGNRVTFEVIPDGDHRLSRPKDIERLFKVIERFV